MSHNHLSTPTLIAYALPYGPIVAANSAILLFVTPLYSIDIGLSLTLVGTILFLTRMFDVATDFIVGALSDRVQTRFGKRKLWILFGMPIMALGIWCLLSPPESVGPVYLTLCLIAFYVGYTFMLINHMAWGAELSPDYGERSRIQSWTHVVFVLFLLAVFTLPAIIESGGDVSTLAKSSAIALLIAGALPVLTVIALFFVPERPQPKTEPKPLFRSLRSTLSNANFKVLLIADLVSAFFGGATSALYVLLLANVLNVPEIVGLSLLIYFAAAILGIGIWYGLSKFLEKQDVFRVSLVVSAIATALFLFIPAGDPAIALATMALAGLPFTAGGMFIRSMIADVVDEDHLETGESKTSLFYAIYNLVNKAGVALPLITLLPLIDAIGFQTDAPNSDEVNVWFRLIFVAPTILGAIILVPLLARYRIGRERQADIQNKLAAMQRMEAMNGAL